MESLVADVATAVRIAAAVAFIGLAVVAIRSGSRHGARAWWVAGAYGSLALVLSYTRVLDTLGLAFAYETQTTVLLLLAFPYCLLRFTASFRALPLWVKGLSTGGVGALVLATISLPPLKRADQTWELVYIIAVLAYWLVLSSVTVVRLWTAGKGQPALARRRMRMMSTAAAALSGAMILLAINVGRDDVWVDLGVYTGALVGAVGFGLGFSPPPGFRIWWSRPEYDQLQGAMMSMMQAKTPAEVAAELLPPTVRVVGGSGAVLIDSDGVVTASYGSAPAEGETLLPRRPADGSRNHTEEVVTLEDGQGDLVVWTSDYTPFFGREEVGLLHAMAGVAALALQRSALLAEERERRVVLEEAQLRADAARQEATRANLAKTEFLSRMSHELRTPLNAILGFGQLLIASPTLPEEDRESVGYVLKGGRHLLDLINEVLDLSRIEAGKMSISLEPTLISELVNNAVALIRPMADNRSIQLNTDLAGCTEFVRTDRQRCSQALLNLLSNAVKYNYDGGTVAVSCRRAGEDRVRVSVTDTGAGIDEGRQRRLFEPFERLGAESSGVEGTGLGLALTKQLIEAMGGAIGVESAPGQGATFWIELPLTDPPADAEELTEQPKRDAASDEGRTLLLVEDNLANLRLIEAMLRRRPEVSVIPAVQGRLAIELAHQHTPDVIVLDLHLPDLTGQEVLHRLQADPQTRHIPVVIASADATPGRMRRLREEGAFDYLTKPLELEPFLDVIDRALASED